MKSFCDYLGLSNSCSYDVDDFIGRADRFGLQNFCSPEFDVLLEVVLSLVRVIAFMCIPSQITCNCYSKVFNAFNIFKVSSLQGI